MRSTGGRMRARPARRTRRRPPRRRPRGNRRRLTPDAPVPVVDCEREHHRAGGAGLAATLAARLAGQDVVLVTALGDDRAGRRVRDLLAGHAEIVYLPLRGTTPSKIRVRAAGQSLVRLDSGDGRAAGEPVDRRVATALGGPAPSWSPTTGAASPPTRSRRLLAGLPRARPWCGTRTRAAPPPCRGPGWSPRTAPRPARSPRGADGRSRGALAQAAGTRRRWPDAGGSGVAVTLASAARCCGPATPSRLLAPAAATEADRATPAAPATASPPRPPTSLRAGGLLTEAVTEAVAGRRAFVTAGRRRGRLRATVPEDDGSAPGRRAAA